MTADQILADAKTRQNSGYWESKIVEFKSWLVHQKKICDNSATSTAMGVRGFFAFHRIPLQFRTSKKKRLSEKSRLTEDYYFSLADIKKLSEVADLEERYIVVAGKSFGLRASDFLKLTCGNLEPHINEEPPISMVASIP
ncbi:MAG TPA: hypothetical protein VMW36_05170 [Patescibacteria group bacterium]|nr:hypothetical protein [Patescibacteria group bacterium]